MYFPCPGRRSIVENRQLRGVRLRKGCGVQARRIDVIVVYKVDRLTRSLADFAKLVETFDAHGVSFGLGRNSVLQHHYQHGASRCNACCCPSPSSSGRSRASGFGTRLPLRRRRGCGWAAVVPLGYRVEDRALHIVEDHAAIVRPLFGRYLVRRATCAMVAVENGRPSGPVIFKSLPYNLNRYRISRRATDSRSFRRIRASAWLDGGHPTGPWIAPQQSLERRREAWPARPIRWGQSGDMP